MTKENRRLEKLREVMKQQRINSLLLTDFINVAYITGFTGGDSFALITRKNQYLITDGRFTEQAERQAPRFSIITRKGEMTQAVLKTVKRHRLRELSFESAAMSYELFRTYKKILAGVRLKPEKPLVQRLRCIKDPGEVRKIRRAVEVAEKALGRTKKILRPGITENDVAAELEYQMRLLGSEKAAFETIVASGKNSSMPHALCSTRRLRYGDSVTIDWGAQVDSYNSDLTRVFFIGRIQPRFRKIYEIVYAAQEAAIKVVRPGVTAQQVDEAAREVIRAEGFGPNFNHSLGHGIGLEVHEAPRLGQKVNVPIQAGMVFTIEPGIYLPGFGGVRLEDDVLVTGRGCEMLSGFTRSLKRQVI